MIQVESPVQCVSGVTGSNLKKRIEAIMTQRITSRLDLGKKLLLAAMGIAAFIGPIAVGLLHAPPSHAQTQAPAAAPLTFEVASVRFIGHQNALPPGAFQLAPRRSGGLLTWTTERSWLVRYAYHLPAWRILGMEPDDLFYAIEAKTDASATEDQIRMMFQTLLADRFKLAVHRETKERTGYALVVGKNGPKIKEVKPDEEATALPDYFKGKIIPDGRVLVTAEHGLRAVTGRRVPMAQLAEALSEPLRAVVLDKTGMRGDYYFAFAFVPDDRPVGSEVDGPSLFAALQEELGLRLEPQKGPVEVLVVDRFEKMPTEN